MKRFNKVLAAILSLVMLLTMIPAAAFAATPSGAPQVKEPTGTNGSTATPDPIGTGADGTITFELDASALIEALRTDGSLVSAVTQALKDMVTRSESDIVTVNDIVDLIPAERMVNALLGADNENASELIAQFGGIEAIAQMVDIDELILTANRSELVAFLKSLNNDVAFIKADEVLSLDLDLDLESAYKYIDNLTQKIEAFTYDDILKLVGNDYAKLKDVVYYDELLQELIATGVVESDEIDAAQLFEIPGVAQTAMNFINWDRVNDPNFVERKVLVATILEGNGTLADVISPENFNAYLSEVNLDPLFEMLEKDQIELNTVVDVDALLSAIPTERYGSLVALFEPTELIRQFKPHILELLRKLNKSQIKDMLVPMLTFWIENIDFVAVNNYVVAEEQQGGDTEGLLAIHYEEALKALVSLIPTLTEIAECEDGKILSFNLYVKYVNVDGKACTKDVNIEFVISDGKGLSALRKLAGKLAEYITVDRDGNQLLLELNMPSAIAKAYARILNSEKGAEIKKQLLAIADMEGAELVEAFEKLSLDQILNVLSKVDVEELYSTLTKISEVEAALERVIALTGLDCDVTTLQDLNAILDAVENGVPTFEAVCNFIERKTKIDVMRILEKTASFADRNATIQAFLDKLSEVPYLGKLIDEHSFTEILETYRDAEPIEAVSDFIAKRLNVNLKEVLKNDANEIYQRALELAAGYENYYVRVKNFVLRVLDPDYVPQSKWEKLAKALIPESVLRKFLASSLTDAYRGNGTFSASAENITVDFKALSEKLLAHLPESIKGDATLMNLIEGFLPSAKVTFGLNLKVHFNSIYGVTYLDENGNKLLTTFLPTGVAPSVAINAPEVAGKEFLYWADASGNEVTSISGDCVLRAVYNQDSYTVSFVYADGTPLHTLEVKKGDKIAYVPTIPSYEEFGLYNGIYTLRWYLGDKVVTEDEIRNMVVTSDLTFTGRYELDPGKEFFDAGDANVTVKKDADGNWIIEIDSADFVLKINRKNGKFEDIKTLTVKAGELVMKLGSDTLAQLVAASGENSVITLSSKFGKDQPVGFETELYKYETKDAYAFDLTIDDQAFEEKFAGDFEITLPFASPLEKNDLQQTVVYVLGKDGHELVDVKADVDDKKVTFAAPHFSDYLIVNEYKVSSSFVDGEGKSVGGTTNLDGAFVPADAEIIAVKPALSEAIAYGHKITKITYLDENDVEQSIARIGDGLKMPARAIEIKAEIGKLTFNTYYVVGSNLYTDKATADAEAKKLPQRAGYQLAEGKWVGNNEPNVNGDVYLTPEYKAITYTLKLEGVSQNVTFTVEDSSVILPAVPEKIGMIGKWKDAKSTPAEWIQAMPAGKTELEVKAEYTNRTYRVFFADKTETYAFGANVPVNATARPGYTLQSVVFVNLNNGNETAVNNGAFQMPASDVRIVVTEVPNTLHLTVLNQTNGSKTDLTAEFDTFASFTIQVPRNAVLDAAPSVGKLVSIKMNDDGTKTLVYSFRVTAEIKDNTEITYRVATKVPTSVRLANGMVTTDENPVSSIKNLTFAGFVTPDGTKFDNMQLEFAKYDRPSTTRSLLWLWILIVVIVLIALIALFYTLYIRGKLKPNFFLRVIVWIVTLFFNICLGISAIVLWILQGTKKKEEIDFHAFGMANPVPAEGADGEVNALNAEPVNAGEEVAEASDEVENNEADTEEAAVEGETSEADETSETTEESVSNEASELNETEGEAMTDVAESAEAETAEPVETVEESAENEASEETPSETAENADAEGEAPEEEKKNDETEL